MNYLGIDVSKAKLDCALLREAGTAKRLDKTFTNDAAGIKALLAWLDSKLSSKHDADANAASGKARVHVLMEPTGVYHERAALRLFEAGLAGLTVSLVNPARLRSYATAIGVVSKNDRLDSAVLARVGAAAKLAPHRPSTHCWRGAKRSARISSVNRTDTRRLALRSTPQQRCSTPSLRRSNFSTASSALWRKRSITTSIAIQRLNTMINSSGASKAWGHVWRSA